MMCGSTVISFSSSVSENVSLLTHNSSIVYTLQNTLISRHSTIRNNRVIYSVAKDQRHFIIIIIQELVVNVATVTSSRHAKWFCPCLFATAKPKFSGCRSFSMVLSQHCLCRPILCLQEGRLTGIKLHGLLTGSHTYKQAAQSCDEMGEWPEDKPKTSRSRSQCCNL